MTDITEIHNPAAVGFRWQAPESSTLYELAWARGTTGFMFGIRPGQQGPWHATRVTNPRFQPTNLKEARTMAQDFANAGAAEAVTLVIHVDVRSMKSMGRDDYEVQTSIHGGPWATQYLIAASIGTTPEQLRQEAEHTARIFLAGIRFAGAEARGTSCGYGL